MTDRSHASGTQGLRVYMFGTFEVFRGEEPVPESEWRTRRARQLLKLLITERPRPVANDRLIEHLWPESPPRAAPITLRSAVNALRNVLEPDRPHRGPSSYILTQAPGYAFRPQRPLWLDVEVFERLLDRAEAAADPRRAQALLEEALALYRDDYLIEDPYADWAKMERERLRERYLAGLLHLARIYAAQGHYQAAIRSCRLVLSRDEVQESAYQALMRYQAESGDSAAALLTYERCRSVLADELGADPSPATQELHQQILNGQIAPRPVAPGAPARARRPAASAEALPQHALLPTLDEASRPSRFVGREREMALLGGMLDRAMAGEGHTVLLAGELGVGKSRLAYQLLSQASDRGATVISAASQPLEQALPFAPLVDGIGRYLELLPDSSLRRLSRHALAQLAQLLPGLADRLALESTGGEGALPPQEYRQRMLDSFIGFLVGLAELRPLVLFLDDVHWADVDTLTVVNRLARRIDAHPILLLLAYREGELVENPALRALVQGLGRNLGVTQLSVERLSPEAVRVLVQELPLPSDAVAEELTRALYTATQGNALFVTEALNALRDGGPQGRSGQEILRSWQEVDRQLETLSRSQRVQSIVRERMDRLPPAALEVLRLAAVIGRDFSLEILEEAFEGDPAEGLEILLQRRFLLERLDERLDFVHQVVRQVAYAELNALQRRRLHRRVAQALVALGKAQENPGEAAFHYGQAGAATRLDHARYAVLAGEKLLRTYSPQQAIGYFDQALQVLERGTEPPSEWIQRAYKGRGLAYESLLDADGVIDTYTRLRRWALDQGEREIALMAHSRMITLLGLVGQQARSSALLADLLAGEVPDLPTWADFMARRRVLFRPMPGDDQDPGQWTPLAAPPPVPGDPVEDFVGAMGRAHAVLPLLSYGWILQVQGQLDTSAHCLEAAVGLAEETGQRSLASLAYYQLGVTLRLMGQIRRSAALNERSKALNHRVHGQAAQLAALWPRIASAYQALEDGDVDRAADRLRRALALLQGQEAFRTHHNSAVIGLGLVALARGRLAEAKTLLHQGLADPEHRYPFTYVQGLLGLARLAQRTGQAERSVGLFRRALGYAGKRSLVREYRACVALAQELALPEVPVTWLQDQLQAHRQRSRSRRRGQRSNGMGHPTPLALPRGP